MATTPPPASRPFWFQDFGDQRHDLVAVDQRAVLVDDHHAVRVAVERDADVGPYLMNLLREAHGMRGAAFLIDVETVRLVVDGNDLGAQFPERQRCHLVPGAIGAIDHDAQATERHRARQCALGELDVPVMHAVDALGASKRILVGQCHIDLAIEHALDAPFDLVRQLVTIRPEQFDAIVVVGIVRGRDHHAEVGAQRTREHRDRRRRYRSQKEDVHARRAEAGDHSVLDHVTGQPCILAKHDAVAVVATLERHPSGHTDLHRHFCRHRKFIGPSPDPVRSEITS